MTVPPTTSVAEVVSSTATNRPALAQAPGKQDSVRTPLGPFRIGLFAIFFIALGIGGMAYWGYRAGVQQSAMASASAVAEEVQLQYSLALQDMQIGQPGVAVQRLEFIVQMNPDFPGVAQMLAKAREASNGVAVRAARPTEATLLVEKRLSTEELFNLLTGAYRLGDWSEAVRWASALKATAVEHRSANVDGMLFVSLRNRGIERIDAGMLELGLTDFEHAEQIMDLDDVALQRARWASLYLAGMTFWELNWQLAIDNLAILVEIAPNFLDTRSLLREAYIAYGEVLLKAQNSCLAGEQFAAAVKITADTKVEQQLAAAVEACVHIVPYGGTSSP